jgi:phosphoribosylformimino-5-aminoimidazole carboxamide ribotide isomerase
MIVFPAIDILDGRCVRLRQGDYERVTVYAADPAEQARAWADQGARWLHVVDLDGAKEGRPVNLSAVERIAAAVDVPVQFGGGIRRLKDIGRLFDLGVERIVLGTTLVTDPGFAVAAIEKAGDRLVAGIDGRNGKVAVAGWLEETDVEVVRLAAEYEERGVARIIYTDISVDGTRRGPNINETKKLAEAVGVPIIASGGVSALEDIEALRDLGPLGVEGVIVGSALYEKTITLARAIEAAG